MSSEEQRKNKTALCPRLTHTPLFPTPLPHFSESSPKVPTNGCWAQPCPAVGLLEQAGTGCVWHGAAPALPHRGPAASSLPKPCSLHPIQFVTQMDRKDHGSRLEMHPKGRKTQQDRVMSLSNLWERVERLQMAGFTKQSKLLYC